jgi:small subunit ribosomal protein S6
MREYELTFIIDPQVDQEEIGAATDEVKGLVESAGGAVREIKPWGLRRLAYPIRNRREGQYVLMEIDLGPQGVAQLERALKLKESVIRHLLVRTDED